MFETLPCQSDDGVAEGSHVLLPSSWPLSLSPSFARAHGASQDVGEVKHKEQSLLAVSALEDPVDCQTLLLSFVFEDYVMIAFCTLTVFTFRQAFINTFTLQESQELSSYALLYLKRI